MQTEQNKAIQPRQVITAQPDAPNEPSPKQSKKKLILIIAGAGIAVVAVIVTLIIILTPRYNLAIDSAYNVTDESVDGVKKNICRS